MGDGFAAAGSPPPLPVQSSGGTDRAWGSVRPPGLGVSGPAWGPLVPGPVQLPVRVYGDIGHVALCVACAPRQGLRVELASSKAKSLHFSCEVQWHFALTDLGCVALICDLTSLNLPSHVTWDGRVDLKAPGSKKNVLPHWVCNVLKG